MKTSLCRLSILAVVVLVTLTGCKDDGPSSKIFVRNGVARPIRVAVLPFESIGRQEDAGQVLTNTVLAYLLSTNVFEVVDPGTLDDAMSSAEGGPYRTIIEALKPKNLQTLQKMLNLDAVIVGTVEEYGDVRIGNDSYPSLSFSARLVDARTGNIIWMGSISKTGADKVTLFDIGRVSSMGKLCKSAVREMAQSMLKSQQMLTLALKPEGGLSPAVLEKQRQAKALEHGTALPAAVEVAARQPESPAPVEQPTTQPATQPTAPAQAEQPAATGGKSTDETKSYGQTELTALLGDASGFKRGEVKYSKHFHDTVEARYTIGDGPGFVDVKLVDYRKVASAQKLVAHYHPGENEGKFRNRPAFVTSNSTFKYTYVDMPVGRFGLFVKGPEARTADMERLVESLINLLQ
jgi:hypothetical protein